MPDDLAPRRKRIRLIPAVYRTLGAICSVTIGVQDRRPVFSDVRAATLTVDALRSHAQRTSVRVYGYCVMPDHVHVVLGPSAACDIVAFVGQFKNLAQRALWQAGWAGRVWQKGFYDHFLRADEQVEHAVEYVLGNPVRAGLVKRWSDYPFCGSLEYEL